jgi:hypothetical protein
VAMCVQLSGAIALLLGLGQIDEFVSSKREQLKKEKGEHE